MTATLAIEELPPAVRRLVTAVAAVRDQLPAGDRSGRTEGWARLDAACGALWDDDDVVGLGDVVPAPGAAMLACRCGRAIGVGTMHRAVRARPAGRRSSGPRIEPIVCSACAAVPTW